MSQITNKNKFYTDSLILKVRNKFTDTNIKKMVHATFSIILSNNIDLNKIKIDENSCD